MDFNEIQAFTKVAQTGSFTAAARELGLPKSTVSRKVAQLEARLGALLLQRTTRKLRLTDVGADYFERCVRILRELEEAELAVTRTQAEPQGTLRITAPVDVGVALLGPPLRAFLGRYPRVRADVVLTDRVLDMVEQRMDLAIRAGALGDSSLVARKIGVAQGVLCASPAYLAQRDEPRSPADLAHHDCILFRAGLEGSTWALQGPRGTTEVHIDARVTVNNFDLVREAVLAGLGIASLPAFRCIDDIRAGRLCRVLPAWSSGGIPLHVLYPSTRHLAPKVRAFLDLLQEETAPWRWQLEEGTSGARAGGLAGGHMV